MVCLVEDVFGTLLGEPVKKFTWTTSNGMKLTAISYGAIIQSIQVPDKDGQLSDIVLGFDNLDSYVTRNVPYFGAAIGRVGNRIKGASFQLEGQNYKLANTIGADHLHGGRIGFDKKNWENTVDGTRVTFSYLSKDLEEGYPGNLLTNITYEVDDEDCLHIDYSSSTDKRTIVNLTNHSYFNLAGHKTGAEEVFKHLVAVNADKITETDSNSIPTGRFLKVGGTPFDLRIIRNLGDLIQSNNRLFDDNFCINTFGNKGLNFVSRVHHPETGRYLEVYSDQPGVQFYTSYYLPAPNEPALIGKDGVGYRRHGAFCLETQNYPDAVHNKNFPSPVLYPGDVYKHRTQFRFGVTSEDCLAVSAKAV